MPMAMHDDEVATSVAIVARLIADQLPEIAHLPIRDVHSTGTVNAVFRVGEALLARLPRVGRWAPDLSKELQWLPAIAPGLSLSIPRPVFSGSPAAEYPLPWAVYEWIDGTPYEPTAVDDETQAGHDLAVFITELRRTDTTGAPPAGREPLLALDGMTRASIIQSASSIDAEGAMQAWDDALATRPWAREPVWIHTDLLPPNLLMRNGRLAAVIDWGGAGVGDPAADVIAAWSVFGSRGRRVFREVLDVDDETWSRARGYALHQAAMIIPYYRTSNPAFVRMAERTVREVLSGDSA